MRICCCHASESLGGKWRDAEVPIVVDALLFVHLRLGSAIESNWVPLNLGAAYFEYYSKELLRRARRDVRGTLKHTVEAAPKDPKGTLRRFGLPVNGH